MASIYKSSDHPAYKIGAMNADIEGRRAKMNFEKKLVTVIYQILIATIFRNLCKTFMMSHFNEMYKPAHVGDYFLVPGVTQTLEFKVLKTDPVAYCTVVPDTTKCTGGAPIEREVRLEFSYFLILRDNRFSSVSSFGFV